METHRKPFIPSPFWPSLAALLGLAALGGLPFMAVGALLWPNATSVAAAGIMATGYLLGIVAVWWLLVGRER